MLKPANRNPNPASAAKKPTTEMRIGGFLTLSPQ
jgi:hypothetical protein